MKEMKYNKQWKFWNEKNAFALVWNVPEEAKEIELPHDAMIGQKINPQSSHGVHSGFRDGGAYVYVNNLYVAEEAKNQTLMLKFEGIHMNAFVYVNEQLAGKCAYGYTTFYVELNDYLRYDQNNEIRVIVKNGAASNSRWYSGGGIYRDVYLFQGGLTYFAPDETQITTQQIGEGYSTQVVATKIRHRGHSQSEVIVETLFHDPEGNKVGEEVSPIFLPGNSERKISQRIVLQQPKLWSAEEPNLYTCTVRIRNEEGILDETVTTFGVRQIQVDAIKGLQINGNMVKLRGACIHHDSGILGAATYEDAQYRQIAKLKEAGFNAIRMAHNPMAPSMLRACDELGMYVMDETFDMWTRSKTDYDYGLFFEEQWEKDVEAMVRKDYNHPCVIMYSVGNEIPEIGTNHGSFLCAEIAAKIQSLDSTRYTLASINGVFAAGDEMNRVVADISEDLRKAGVLEGNVNSFMALMEKHMDVIVKHPAISKRLEKACVGTDIAGYNYLTSRYEEDGKSYPNRVIVGSETYPPEIARNWKEVLRLDHVIGDFTWTGWDYLGEAGVGIPAYAFGEGGFSAKYPCNLAYCGDIDITGFRRPASYYREIVFGLRKEPYITVQDPHRYGQKVMKTPWILSDSVSSWTWPGCEEQPVVVEIYSAGDEVELLCNHKSLGRKPAGDSVGYITYFDTVYTQGDLVAITYESGKEIGRMTLATAKASRQVVASLEQGKNKELVFIDIQVVDEQGTLCTDETGEIQITIEGTMQLLGLGSANPKGEDGFFETKTHLFQGRAQGILKRTEDAGVGTIRIKYKEEEIIVG